ncbi:MAG: 4-hydroxy-tetrahydrodipicolinate synthase [Bacteroidetes bacterium RIFCSPHIGHO2_02_FULL_44_7]|nr:MAG: 4-hydroxy-tetrahydrodipicolinate synthase [Bacteroidetes bacterium RIFCSPHIGHO2_02_FULL_44_7]
MTNPFFGSGVALVTPFNEDHSIDFDALRALVRYQISNGTDFLVVQGTTGESPTLSKAEKLEVLKVVQDENKGALKVVFGVGGNNTVEVGNFLKSLPGGIDGILSVSPYYNKPTQAGIVAHFRYLAECTSLPIILYNVPGRTGSNMSAATTLELAKVENIVAVKEASGDFGQIMQILHKRPEGFGVLSGDDAITMPLIAVGADGVISVVANAYPKKFSQMVHTASKGDFATSRALHYDLLPVTNMLFEEGNPGGVKIALERQGIMRSIMRPPLHPVSDDLRARISLETDRLIH